MFGSQLALFSFHFVQTYTKVTFGTGESTLLPASRFLGMRCLAIWMPSNVTIPMFGLIENLIRFLRI